MDLNTQVAIISVFGRGHWLAMELARAQIPTLLIDVTDQMGPWAPEDGEGPFGFFKSEKVSPTLLERMASDDSLHEVTEGFTLWLEQGPVEMKGPLIKYHFEKLGLSGDLQEAILKGGPCVLKDEGFEKMWLVHLGNALDATVYLSNVEGAELKSGLPLGASFYVRHATRTGQKKSLEWCRSKGVQVPEKIHVVDVALKDKNTLAGIEVRTDRPRIVTAEQFVCCLSGEELGLLGAKVQHALFPKGIVEPEWAWVRYRVKIKENLPRECIPLHCVIVPDLRLPWTHENLIIIQRTTSPELFDAWIRIPNVQRFNKQYVMERGEHLLQVLRHKVHNEEVSISEYPQEYSYTYNQIGSTRHPVFRRSDLRAWKSKNWSNVIFDGPEFWNHLGAEGWIESQKSILSDLVGWWQRKEEIRIKREQRQRSAP